MIEFLPNSNIKNQEPYKKEYIDKIGIYYHWVNRLSIHSSRETHWVALTYRQFITIGYTLFDFILTIFLNFHFIYVSNLIYPIFYISALSTLSLNITLPLLCSFASEIIFTSFIVAIVYLFDFGTPNFTRLFIISFFYSVLSGMFATLLNPSLINWIKSYANPQKIPKNSWIAPTNIVIVIPSAKVW